jgi:tetratricopeptide (TPR) repeat protein
MKARIGRDGSVSVLAVGAMVAFGLCGTVASPRSASADAIIRLVNGRELAVEDYWFAGGQVMFSRARGTVGLPRALVAAIGDAPPPANIGGRGNPVNAPRLSGARRSVRLAPAVATKDEHYDRAIDLVAEGDLDGAIAAYREALALEPAFTDAIHGLAMAYADKGMYDQAIEWGKRLVELTPDDTLAHTSLSMFYQRKGMIAEAEAEGAKARVLDWKRQLAEQTEPKKEGEGS